MSLYVPSERERDISDARAERSRWLALCTPAVFPLGGKVDSFAIRRARVEAVGYERANNRVRRAADNVGAKANDTGPVNCTAYTEIAEREFSPRDTRLVMEISNFFVAPRRDIIAVYFRNNARC